MSTAEAAEARALIIRPVLTFDERVRLAAHLRYLLDDDAITEDNIFTEGADARFMRLFYPGAAYHSNPIAAGRLAQYGHTIASGLKGDFASLAAEAFSIAARKGIIDTLVNVAGARRTAPPVPPPMPAARSEAERERTKREIRLLLLARHKLPAADRAALIRLLGAHYLGGIVTSENYGAVGLRFLLKYYPDDYRREVAAARDRSPPGPPSASPRPSPPAEGLERRPPGYGHHDLSSRQPGGSAAAPPAPASSSSGDPSPSPRLPLGEADSVRL